jgi:bidirectional [NiFe] hydrogenase diaphorase subunit
MKAGEGETAKRGQDHRWRLVNRTMRLHGNEPHALIETLHAVQEHFGFLEPNTSSMWPRASEFR